MDARTFRVVTVAAFALLMPAITYAAIEISTIEELQRIGNDAAYPLNGNYVLTRDIDASRTAWWNNGAGFAPIGSRGHEDDESLCFNGWFDGLGHVIRGLVINRPEESMVGLFGSVGSRAVVANLGLEGGSVAGRDYVGSLIGENWSVSVVGCRANSAVEGNTRVGGLVGINRGLVEMSYATGLVSGVRYVGGLVGRNYEGLVEECYAAGPVRGVYGVGGLVGETVDGAVVASFWDMDASGLGLSGGGWGVTTVEMMSPDTFMAAEWDIRNNWGILPGRGRPYLR